MPKAKVQPALPDTPEVAGWVVTGDVITCPDHLVGEKLTATSEPEAYADFLDWIKEATSDLDAQRREVERVIVERMDRAGSWSLTIGDGRVISMDSPEAHQQWDAAGLDSALQVLELEGTIETGAAARAWRTRVVREPAAAVLKGLMKVPAVAKVLAPLRTPKATERRATVRRP